MARSTVTQRDVALKAGVSVAAVSYVLNGRAEEGISEETKERVFQAVKELGYVPNTAAQALARGRTKSLGLLVVEKVGDDTQSVVTSELIFGILSVTDNNNLSLMVEKAPLTGDKESYLRMAQAKSIDGLIISVNSLTEPGVQYLSENNFPVVVLGYLPETNLYTVDFDNYGGARAVTEHLLSLGHKHIACITYTSDRNDTGMIERLRGYKEALAAAGIPFDERLVRFGVETEQSGYKNMVSILDGDVVPTAVFGLNDAVALGAMAAIQERGLIIPKSIAVAGFDDVPFAPYVNPSLTSVKISFRELGRLATQTLVDLVEKRSVTGRHITIPTELKIRKSTDPNR